uniref:Transposase n=1 Tax=Gracilinema caldarium TaxID=215591 RepID=A0A7C3IL25_9SPIR
MARKPRELLDGCSYHVTMRINNRLFYFENKEAKRIFIEVMKKVERIYKCVFEIFVLMNNHVHLVIRPQRGNDLPGIMHRLALTFSKRFNKRFKQTGHVWESRYFSRPLKSILEAESVFRYIAKNPVKAKLVKNPKDWFWSSIAFYERGMSLFIDRITDEMRAIYEKFSASKYSFVYENETAQ